MKQLNARKPGASGTQDQIDSTLSLATRRAHQDVRQMQTDEFIH